MTTHELNHLIELKKNIEAKKAELYLYEHGHVVAIKFQVFNKETGCHDIVEICKNIRRTQIKHIHTKMIKEELEHLQYNFEHYGEPVIETAIETFHDEVLKKVA
jgi:hypothetical protein